jgi:hypothetical protein
MHIQYNRTTAKDAIHDDEFDDVTGGYALIFASTILLKETSVLSASVLMDRYVD